jgi:hypothetical protein
MMWPCGFAAFTGVFVGPCFKLTSVTTMGKWDIVIESKFEGHLVEVDRLDLEANFSRGDNPAFASR